MTKWECFTFFIILTLLIIVSVGCGRNIEGRSKSNSYIESLNLPRTSEKVVIDIDPEKYEWSKNQKLQYYDGIFTMTYARKYNSRSRIMN